MEKLVKKTKGLTRDQNRLIFYSLMLIWPVLQIAIFYFYVNANTVILAFQEISMVKNELGITVESKRFNVSNFSRAWNVLIVEHWPYILNSAKFYAIDFPIALILALSFSFYIYKKYPCAGLFKTMLFMPSLISGLVFCILFRYLSTYGYKEIMCLINDQPVTQVNRELYKGLLENPNTAMPTLIFYNIWVSFGSNILLYSGAMSGIDESVCESAHLDGANLLQEFWHITLPLIFPTIISLTVVSLTGIFTNQLGLLNLFGESISNMPEIEQKLTTIGYRMYIYAKKLTNSNFNFDAFGDEYYTEGELAAYGLLVSLLIIPLVLGIRSFMKKYGPSTD
jgi:ABC-type sugar transport system permease subunit